MSAAPERPADLFIREREWADLSAFVSDTTPGLRIGMVEDVAITSGTDVVARHPRYWGSEHITFDALHYLALSERKPGAFDFARPLENWELPANIPAGSTSAPPG
jgi:hypothetical protein